MLYELIIINLCYYLFIYLFITHKLLKFAMRSNYKTVYQLYNELLYVYQIIIKKQRQICIPLLDFDFTVLISQMQTT